MTSSNNIHTSFADTFAAMLAETETGKPFVYDEGDEVSLMFDLATVQSRMKRTQPNELILGYTRAMLGFCLMQEYTHKIGMIGLGGGSLAKYCHHYLPESQIEVAEIDQRVIDLGPHFLIPSTSPRLRIQCADGAHWLARTTTQFDTLLIDAYGPQGMPEDLASTVFFDQCRAQLSPAGILVVNLWGSDKRFESYYSRIRTIFDGAAIAIGADGCANRIVYGFNQSRLPAPRLLQQRCRQLASQHSVDLPALGQRLTRAMQAADGLEPLTPKRKP
ncbi:fused MFS/spermidine synthase [Chitinibacter bivalviorum]|uniref:Fused MFS/spermidine synthase n=1 Tax=Chitinibacter bivalviorum TaxID=2739434 RepID=A0A7H9BDX1_9NEIS|nr:fused MFS/spermidine synthase [Chitinibacter bivalviorum]QLG86910.1 fused MFS/spermidine synthase [Chitinibacter bivalviorum]